MPATTAHCSAGYRVTVSQFVRYACIALVAQMCANAPRALIALCLCVCSLRQASHTASSSFVYANDSQLLSRGPNNEPSFQHHRAHNDNAPRHSLRNAMFFLHLPFFSLPTIIRAPFVHTNATHKRAVANSNAARLPHATTSTMPAARNYPSAFSSLPLNSPRQFTCCTHHHRRIGD
jgi:hypothetical protein